MTAAQASLILCPAAKQREKIARRRLKVLCDEGLVKRTRNHVGAPYVYYIGKKQKSWAHTLKITDFYVRYYQNITNWILEPILGKIRPDVLAEIEIYSKRYLIAYEAQISGRVDIKKYERLYLSGAWGNILPVFPIVVAGGEYEESKIIKVVGEEKMIDEICRYG
ncbi:replication-relaxation family protein [Tepidanaerobacter syntrophicus]|nr:replication-relaxation family protein [Tepidanaerobacter syntrophicus]